MRKKSIYSNSLSDYIVKDNTKLKLQRYSGFANLQASGLLFLLRLLEVWRKISNK